MLFAAFSVLTGLLRTYLENLFKKAAGKLMVKWIIGANSNSKPNEIGSKEKPLLEKEKSPVQSTSKVQFTLIKTLNLIFDTNI